MKINVATVFAVISSCAGMQPALAASSQIDAGLFATFSASQTSVSFVVCGSLPESEGCYGSATLSPFESVCAVLQGTPNYKTNGVVERDIYILDRRASKNASVLLYVYKRKDTISDGGYDSVSTMLARTVPLASEGGPNAKCSMAGNNAAIYAGTSKDTFANVIDKNTYVVTRYGGFSPPAHLHSITADERGYVAIHFDGGFYVVGPDGRGEEDGGGAADMINTRNGWIPN